MNEHLQHKEILKDKRRPPGGFRKPPLSGSVGETQKCFVFVARYFGGRPTTSTANRLRIRLPSSRTIRRRLAVVLKRTSHGPSGPGRPDVRDLRPPRAVRRLRRARAVRARDLALRAPAASDGVSEERAHEGRPQIGVVQSVHQNARTGSEGAGTPGFRLLSVGHHSHGGVSE